MTRGITIATAPARSWRPEGGGSVRSTRSTTRSARASFDRARGSIDCVGSIRFKLDRPARRMPGPRLECNEAQHTVATDPVTTNEMLSPTERAARAQSLTARSPSYERRSPSVNRRIEDHGGIWRALGLADPVRPPLTPPAPPPATRTPRSARPPSARTCARRRSAAAASAASGASSRAQRPAARAAARS